MCLDKKVLNIYLLSKYMVFKIKIFYYKTTVHTYFYFYTNFILLFKLSNPNIIYIYISMLKIAILIFKKIVSRDLTMIND